jgi:hypothetical protein
MEKTLDWEALQTDEGKFALGFVLVEELKTQMEIKNRAVHLGAAIFIDLFGEVKISPQDCPIIDKFKNLQVDEKIKYLLDKKFAEEEILKIIETS